METLDGQEVWTDIFGDRTCVGIKDGYVITDGKKIKPTSKQAKSLWDVAFEAEFGTRAEVNAMLEAEFGVQ